MSLNKRIFFLTIVFFAVVIGAGLGYDLYRKNVNIVAPSKIDPVTIIEKKEENRENVAQVPLKVPEGFNISVFAKDLPRVRVIIFDPQGNMLASLLDKGLVVAMPDSDHDGRADSNLPLITGLRKPHGLALDCETGKKCHLYVAEEDKVSIYDYDPGSMEVSKGEKIIDLPAGGSHITRSLLIAEVGGKKKLLISMGSTCNVCVEKDPRRAAIYSSELDGSDFKLFAKGLRNSVFMATDPLDGRIWATDNGRDLLGDKLPPDEINIIEEGGNYGWPLCYGKNVHDTDFDKNTYIRNPCQEPLERPSHIDLPAHNAPLGLAFFPETGWPEEYRNDLLVALHGSWNSSVPVGYKIVRIRRDSAGTVSGIEDFMTGWLTRDFKQIGRPVAIIITEGGAIYFSDDSRGVIYRLFRESATTSDKVRVDSPDLLQPLASPLQIKGEARGAWYFEASFPIRLYDGRNKLLATGIAQAQGEWMTENFVPFVAELKFAKPETENGILVFEKGNPSGLPEHSEEMRVPVRFAPSGGAVPEKVK